MTHDDPLALERTHQSHGSAIARALPARGATLSVFQRYWSLALLFCAGALNLFDRQIANILAQDIKTDLGISDGRLGLITGTAFALFYATLGIPLGRLADRVDRVKLMAAALVLWSGFTALCGHAGSFIQLFLARMGVGVGEAGAQPASTAMIPDLFPEGRRTSAMSILLVGAPAGSFLGLLIGGYIGSTWGWRTAFIVAGIPGFVLAAIMLATMRDPNPTRLLRKDAVPSFQATIRTIAINPRFVWLVVGLTCASFFPYASGAWLPPFLIRVHGMTTAQVGRYAAIAIGLGGAVGTLAGGFLCDLLRSRIRAVESKVLIAALGVAVPTLFVTVLATERSIAVLSMFIFNLCAYAFLGPTVRLIQKEVPSASHALAIALSIAVSNIVNLGVGVPLVGSISDALTPTLGRSAVGYALAICALVVGATGMFANWRASQHGPEDAR